MPAINVVVTCTNRKRDPVPSHLKMRNLRVLDLEQRVRSWIERLESNHVAVRPASEMYIGEYWSVVRSLASRRHVQTWICSAGYGLIPYTAPIRPYAASFSRSTDSIARRLEGAERVSYAEGWWRKLSKWRGPDKGAPRTLRQLADSFPTKPILVVASPDYLNAMACDLRYATKSMRRKNMVSVISTNVPARLDIADLCIPVSARLLEKDENGKCRISGARTSLNARVADLLLQQLAPEELTTANATSEMKKLIDRCPRLKNFDRQPRTDEQVCAYIEQQLSKDPELRYSTLLRMFRDAGSACEYSRFANLWKRVKKKLS